PRTVSQSISRVPARRISSRWATVAPMATRLPIRMPAPIRLVLRVTRGSLGPEADGRLQADRFDVGQSIAEDALRDAGERPYVAGGRNPVLRGRCSITARVEHVEQVLDRDGGGECRVDHRHPTSRHALDGASQ